MNERQQLIEFVEKSNQFYNNSQYQESLDQCLAAYEKLDDDSTEKKRLLFNLSLLYIRLKNPYKAKECLDKIKNDSFIFSNLKELALLYESLAILFTITTNQTETYKLISQCYELSAVYYAKCKLWSNYCINELENARILSEYKHLKESLIIADKVLTVTLYLDDSTETHKILNNLATLYSKDFYSRNNLKTSARLLRKIYELTNDCVYLSNYLGVLNELGIQRNKKIETEPSLDNEVKVYFYFNLGYSKFISEAYHRSIEYFEKSLETAGRVKLRDIEVKTECLESIASGYWMIQDYEKAKTKLEEAYQQTGSLATKERLRIKIEKCDEKFGVIETIEEKRVEFVEEKNEELIEETIERPEILPPVDSIEKKTETMKKNIDRLSEQDTIESQDSVVNQDDEINVDDNKIVSEQAPPRLYNDSNGGSVINHPEDRLQETKKSKICLIM